MRLIGEADLFKRAGRDVVHQEIPDQLDEVFAGCRGPGERRVSIQIVMIETRYDFLFHCPIEFLR
jgi:hypothetical protein